MVQLKQINLVKWGGAVLLAMMMALVFVPSQVFAEKADDIKVFMTVSDQGVIASTKDGKAMAWQEVTVEDLDENGEFTFDEALKAAHKQYNSEDGFAYKSSGWVTKMWGVENPAGNSFFKNDRRTDLVIVEKVVAGDHLVATINQDEELYADWAAYFDAHEKTVSVGESFDLTVKGFPAMTTNEPIPGEGLQIGTWEEGVFKKIDGVVADDKGQVTLSFDKPGSYIVSAQGLVTDALDIGDSDEGLWKLVSMGRTSDSKIVYGTTDWDTGEMNYAYTDEDYGDGPVPWNEIKYADYYDYGDADDFVDSCEGYPVYSPIVTYSCPTIAPCCIVNVAGEPADVTMTVNEKGVLAQAKDGSAMVEKKVTVEDLNFDGKLSYDEALVAAHAEYCSTGADGLVLKESAYGGKMVARLWGVDTPNTLLFANEDNFSESVDAYFVEAGDDLYASINKDEDYYADFKTTFAGKNMVATTTGEITVSVLGRMGMAWTEEAKQNKPLKGIQLGFWKDGVFEPIEGAVTDADGKCTFSVKEEGEYLLTAQGTVEAEVADYSEYPDVKIVTANCPTMAPYCNLEITKSSKLSEQKMEALNELMADYDLSNYDLAEQVQVLAAINAAQGKILTAESTADIEKALAEGREYLDQIKTSDVKKAEKKAAEAKEIKKVKAAKITGVKVKAGKKKATVKWKKNTTFAGYQIQYKTGKAKAKTVKVTNVKTVKKVIKKLKKGKKYSFKVRGYKKIGGKVYYGKWSKVIKKKIK